MSKAKELSDQTPLYFNETEKLTAILLTIDCFLGVICDLIIIWALVGATKSVSAWWERMRSMSPGTRFILLLLFGDLIFVSTQTTVGTMAIIAGGYQGGPWGCVWDMWFTLLGQCIAVTSLCAMTIERYLAVRWGQTITSRTSSRACLFIFCLSVLLVCTALMPSKEDTLETIGLDSAKFVCTLAWYSKTQFSIYGVSIVVTIIVGCICIITFCYVPITLYFLKVYGEKKKHANNDILSKSDKLHPSHQRQESNFSSIIKILDFDEKERKLISKSVALVLCFFSCFGPYLFKILYEIATSEPMGILGDFLCHFVIGFYSFLNALLLIFLDNRIRGNVFELFGRRQIKPKSYTTKSKSNQASTLKKKSELAKSPIASLVATGSLSPGELEPAGVPKGDMVLDSASDKEPADNPQDQIDST